MPKLDVRILVALGQLAKAHPLVRIAATLVTASEGELYLTHAMAPGHTPESAESARRGLDHAVALAAELGVKASPHLVEGSTVTQAIQDSVRNWDCSMLVMGWYGDVERSSILAAENRALAKSLDIDTLIFKDKGFESAAKILVPTGGGGHSLMGLQIAHDLARVWGAQLSVMRIARDKRCQPQDPILKRYCDQVLEDTQLRLRLLNIDTPIEIVPSPEVVPPIVERAADADLLVLGASNDWRQDEYLVGSIPDEIAFHSPCSVLMVRSRATTTSQLSNIFWEHTIRLDLHPKDKWEAI
ncbi:MAG: universal stress protein, partial [Chloroflexi bacterium]|nr:universal stress protein [Chloroflexota bacterium]